MELVKSGQIPKGPVANAVMQKTPDGAYVGAIYIALNGIPAGGIEIRAMGMDPLKALANALLTYIQAQDQIVIANGMLPVKPL